MYVAPYLRTMYVACYIHVCHLLTHAWWETFALNEGTESLTVPVVFLYTVAFMENIILHSSDQLLGNQINIQVRMPRTTTGYGGPRYSERPGYSDQPPKVSKSCMLGEGRPNYSERGPTTASTDYSD